MIGSFLNVETKHIKEENKVYGIIVLAVYAALMVGATLLFSRKATSKENFHVADRNIGTVISAFSIASTWIWAPSLFTSAEKAYGGLPGFFWFLVPNVLCLLFFIPFAKRMRSQFPQGITLSGYMHQTYKSEKVKGVYMAQLGLLSVLSTAVQLLAGSKILSLLTGLPFWLLTIILAVVAFSYSQFSGIKASVITDAVQYGLILAGCAIIVPWALREHGGVATLLHGLSGSTGQNLSLFGQSGRDIFLSFGLPTTIGLISGPFGDQSFWQRVFSIRKNSIGKGFGIGAILFALVPLSMGTVGFLAAGMGFKAQDTGMVNFEFIKQYFPAWVMIPFLFMIVSGLLSTVDSNLCSIASLTTDRRKEETGEQNIRTSKITMALLLLVGIAIANIPGLTVTHLFMFYGTVRASTLFTTILTLKGKKLTPNSVFVGVICSMAIGVPVFAMGSILNVAVLKTVGSLLAALLSGTVAMVLTKREGAKLHA